MTPDVIPQRVVNAPLPTAPATRREARELGRQSLAVALRSFERLDGIDPRGVFFADPELTDHFWTYPATTSCWGAKVVTQVLADPAGRVVEGVGEPDTAAVRIAQAIGARRPDVAGIVFATTTLISAFTALGRPLRTLSQDDCIFYDDHAVVRACPWTADGSARVMAEALGARKALLVTNYGAMTVGRTVDEAAAWFIALDRACGVQLSAVTAGVPLAVPDDIAAATAREIGSPYAGWLAFQPIRREMLTQGLDSPHHVT